MSKRFLIVWHRRLAWLGGGVVLCWAVSGISHPMMAWFGPQAVKMFPPATVMPADSLRGLAAVVESNMLREARSLKVVPGAGAPLLQLTESEKSPRRYFDLVSARELQNQDEIQARWLAGYYTGRELGEIDSVRFLAAFDAEYPAINRLLPVYRVQYQGDEELTAFVHTETAALAALNNRNKTLLQNIFQQLHTWAWLDVTGHGRVLLIALFMLTLFLMASAGLTLLVLLGRRKIADARRRWHRLLAYVVFLPLLGWSASGFYHLLQSEYAEQVSGLRLGSAFSLEGLSTVNISTVAESLPAEKLTALSIISGPEGQLYYRAALAPDDEALSREARFQGRGAEKAAVYIDAKSGKHSSIDDGAVVSSLVQHWRHHTPVLAIERLQRFSPDYDFRNKRLPVWLVTIDDAEGSQLFLDPATGVLVDQSRRSDRIERWVFSILHKWNHLTGITGRGGRDALIVAILVLAIAATVLGGVMLMRGRNSN